MPRSSSLVAVLAFVLAMAFAAPSAFADFQYASTVTQTNISAATRTGVASNVAGAPDGVTVRYTATAAGAFFQLRFDFASAINSGGTGQPSFILYGLVTTGTGQVRHVTWSIDTTNSGDPQIFGLNRTISSGTAVPVLLAVNQFSPSFSTGTAYKSLFVDFTLVNSGDSITLDAVSNPEPGTFALFALGTAVLGGLGLRRRKAVRRSDAAA